MLDVTRLESEVLQLLLSGDHPTLEILRRQTLSATVLRHVKSSAGFCVYFGHESGSKRVPSPSRFQLCDVVAEIKGLQHGAGFVLFVEDGLISSLEGYSYGETWPENLDHFKLDFISQQREDLSILDEEQKEG